MSVDAMTMLLYGIAARDDSSLPAMIYGGENSRRVLRRSDISNNSALWGGGGMCAGDARGGVAIVESRIFHNVATGSLVGMISSPPAPPANAPPVAPESPALPPSPDTWFDEFLKPGRDALGEWFIDNLDVLDVVRASIYGFWNLGERGFGGGIHAVGALDLVDSTIFENSAEMVHRLESGDYDEVVQNDSQTNQAFVQNDWSGGGGLNIPIRALIAYVNLVNTTIANNSAMLKGGGLTAHSGYVHLSMGSRIEGNHAPLAANVFNLISSVTYQMPTPPGACASSPTSPPLTRMEPSRRV